MQVLPMSMQTTLGTHLYKINNLNILQSGSPKSKQRQGMKSNRHQCCFSVIPAEVKPPCADKVDDMTFIKAPLSLV